MARKRVQLDFSEKGFSNLQELKERSDAQTNAELVRKALATYKWVLDQMDAGKTVYSVSDNFEEVVELAFL